MRTALVISTLLAICLGSCKYEEGPLISLRTKKDRVVNIWSFSAVTDSDGTDRTSEYAAWWISLDQNQGVHIRYTVSGSQQDQLGSWAFGDKKKSIILDYSNNYVEGFIPKTLEIKRLHNLNMIVEGEGLVLNLSGSI